jgi:LysM repeat protein
MRSLLLAALLLACAFAAPARAQGALADRIEDLRRTAAVRAALALDAQTRPYDVGVTTLAGVVTLVGVVGTTGARERAEALASAVDGVRLVQNSLRIEGQPDVPATRTAPREAAASREPEEDEREDEVAAAAEPERSGEEAAPEEPPAPQPRTVYHTVRSGDTLYSIARRYGTTVQALQRLNDLGSTDIRAGQRLRVR